MPPEAETKRLSTLRKERHEAMRFSGKPIMTELFGPHIDKYSGKNFAEPFPDAGQHECLRKAVVGYSGHLPEIQIPELGYQGRKEVALTRDFWHKTFSSPRGDGRV